MVSDTSTIKAAQAVEVPTPFATEAPKYWAKGVSVMPVVGKKPIVLDWTRFSTALPSESEQFVWTQRYRDLGIGLIAGAQSKIVGIDIDTEDETLIAAIERALPPSPWVRKGRRGKMLAYKWSGQKTFSLKDKERREIVALISTGKQFVLPPSIHPDTGKPYVANVELLEVLDQLAELPEGVKDTLAQVLLDHGIASLLPVPSMQRSLADSETNRILADRRQKRVKKAGEPELESILAGCAWMRKMELDQEKQAEEDWVAMLGIVGRCGDGDKLAHAMSRGYPGYSKEETEQKLQHALNNMGPRKCASINCEPCKACTFLNVNGHSPMTLGYSSPPVVEVVKDAVYVNETEEVVSVADRYSLKLAKYAKSVQHIVKAKPSDQILQSPSLLKVRKRDYVAGNDNLVVGEAVNTWRRDGIEAIEGDARELVQFQDRLIPDAASLKYILDYVAHLVQFPEVKIKSALMITGPQGTGKSTFARLVSRFFGRNARKVGGSEFTGRFQERLVDCQLLHVEEAAHGGKFEAAERLKDMVTAEWFGVEGKNKDMRDARTPRGIILLTNHEAGVVIDDDDRRWHVSATCNYKMGQDVYARVNELIDGDGASAFLHTLMTRDLSAFNPDEEPPMTEAKRIAQMASATPLEGTLRRLIAEGEGIFARELLTLTEVLTALRFYPGDVGKVTEPRVAAVLRKVGAMPLGVVRIGPGSNDKVSPWAIRRAEEWAKAEPAFVSRSYLAGKFDPLKALPHVVEEEAIAR